MADRKQNILPAISDDLLDRIKALQALYLVDGKPSTVEQIIERGIDLIFDKRNEGDLR